MIKSTDVVIIGGGIQGLSLAYHLTARGLKDVCLVEMDTLGSGSSGRSATAIGHAFQSERCLPLTQWSLAALERFEQEIGSPSDYRPFGCLLLGGKAGGVTLRRRHTLLQSLAVESYLLEPDEALRHTPGLNLDGIEMALYLPRDGGIDAHAIMMGYSRQARRRGASILEGVRAIGLQTAGGRVTGVTTDAGPIAAPVVVNAAGAHAREVASWAGVALPITNSKRHILVTGPVATYNQSIPFTYDMDNHWYMRREGPGLLLGMGEEPCEPDDIRVDQASLEQIMDYAIYRSPSLAEAGYLTSWAGIRPMTPDEDPILGPVPQLENFINDCGWDGIGVMNAPAGGVTIAELIIDGQSTSLDITPFYAERFWGEP